MFADMRWRIPRDVRESQSCFVHNLPLTLGDANAAGIYRVGGFRARYPTGPISDWLTRDGIQSAGAYDLLAEHVLHGQPPASCVVDSDFAKREYALPPAESDARFNLPDCTKVFRLHSSVHYVVAFRSGGSVGAIAGLKEDEAKQVRRNWARRQSLVRRQCPGLR